jgi:hypothetical protein
MASIFISYRRAKRGKIDAAWARLLVKELGDRFDLFFDTQSIDYGDRFPDRIRDALESCRVFFAVIGPDWTKRKNITRLRDEKDWVRREIETVLHRDGVKVVPLYVGDAHILAEGDLPGSLSLLTKLQGCKLSHDKWTTDCQELLGKTESWLSGRLIQSSMRQPLPSALPFLCNRIEQEEGLIEVIRHASESDNIFAFILHGHKWEAHNGFIDRLRYLGLLEKILRCKDAGVSIRPLEWNRESVKAGQYEEALKNAIKRNVIVNPYATDQELREYFKTLLQPVIFVMQVTWSDYKCCGANLFKGIVRAWKEIFIPLGGQGNAGASSLPHPLVLWMNVSYDESQQELANELLAGSVLPRLGPLSESHIAEWMEKRDVKPYIAGREPQVLALTDDGNACCEKGKLHMMKFAECLQKIMSG